MRYVRLLRLAGSGDAFLYWLRWTGAVDARSIKLRVALSQDTDLAELCLGGGPGVPAVAQDLWSLVESLVHQVALVEDERLDLDEFAGAAASLARNVPEMRPRGFGAYDGAWSPPGSARGTEGRED